MTTIEIIQKAKKMAEKYCIVRQINFSQNFDFEDNTHDLEITVFYKKDNVNNNLTARITSHFDHTTVKNLFLTLSLQLEGKFLKQNQPENIDLLQSSNHEPATI